MKFSGHETFPVRYAWLPKAYAALAENALALSDHESAMVQLGVGKNMVTAIRFWAQAMGIAEPAIGGGYTPTSFGHAVFAVPGLDPYLEDIRTLWLLHWRICQNVDDPLFAWDYMINRWHLPEMSISEVLPVLMREASLVSSRGLSEVTLGQHLDVFLHTYVPTRSRKGEVLEDNLDSPLVELELIQQIGERLGREGGRREPVFAFRRGRKPEITPGLFMYVLHDFWATRHPAEQTLSFREIAVGHGGPGQVLKLTEEDLRERLDTILRDSRGRFSFRDSSAVPHVAREVADEFAPWADEDLLGEVYRATDSLAMTHG